MEQRTIQQNKYLHMAFELVKDGLIGVGYDEVKTKEDAKLVCKVLFKVEHTSNLNTKEFALFVDQIQRWSAEYLGVIIPDPKQDNYFSRPSVAVATYDENLQVTIVD